MDNLISKLERYVAEVTSVIAALILIACATFGVSINDRALIATIGLTILINMMAINRKTAMISTILDKNNANQSLASSYLIGQSSIVSQSIADLTRQKRGNQISIEILETPYDFYRALNSARSESTKTIRVMKLHHLGPQDADHEDVVSAASKGQSGNAELEIGRWYDGMNLWNNVPGRLVERIMTTPSESMKLFRDGAKEKMRGTTYISHILPWDGELPLLNLCVFDDNQVVITFSTKQDENPYKPIPGLRIKSKDVLISSILDTTIGFEIIACRKRDGVDYADELI